MTFKTTLNKYFADKSGQFAVTTAILALPLMMVASLALDSHRMGRGHNKLKSALDNAAIAAITHQTLNSDERKIYAEKRFWANMPLTEGVSVTVKKAESHRVEIEGQMQVPTLLTGIVGKDIIKVTAFSATELVKGSTVCMLALDPDSARSFEVTEGASLDANCGIQVNSNHELASVVDHGGKAVAENFCIAGGAFGEHYPYVNTECSSVADPYEKIEVPLPGECINEEKLKELMNDWRAGRDAIDEHEVKEYQRWADAETAGQVWYPTFFEKVHLSPGNYCNGLFLEGKEFILDPGVYHITNGTLDFGLGTELIGEGVTFVLHDDANLKIRDGSILNLKGPSDGPLKGLVIAQEMRGKPLTSPSYPNAKSTITDGAKLNLLGTVYLPTQKIEFLGGSLSKTRAPATSFIAHQISIRDGADIGVSTDHTLADIPPILPRSDDSARLVQ